MLCCYCDDFGEYLCFDSFDDDLCFCCVGMGCYVLVLDLLLKVFVELL